MPKVGPTLDYLGMLSVLIFILTLAHCHVDEAFTSENWIVCLINFFIIQISYWSLGPNIQSQD